MRVKNVGDILRLDTVLRQRGHKLCARARPSGVHQNKQITLAQKGHRRLSGVTLQQDVDPPVVFFVSQCGLFRNARERGHKARGYVLNLRRPIVIKSPPSRPSERIHASCASQPSNRQLSAAGAKSSSGSSPIIALGYARTYSTSFSSNQVCTSARVWRCSSGC